MTKLKADFWDAWYVVRSIQELRKAGIALNFDSVHADHSAKCIEVLRRVTGRKTCGRGLTQASLRIYKKWDRALRTAGVRPSRVRKMGERIKWDKNKIRKVILLLRQNGFALNHNAILRAQAEIKAITCKELSMVVTSYSLRGAAFKIFGSWDDALAYAGINPGEVRLWGRRVSHLPVVPHQKEYFTDSRKLVRRQVVFGASSTPADEFERKEIRIGLDAAVRGLPAEERKFAQKILQIVADLPSGLAFESRIACIADALGGQKYYRRTERILTLLRQNRALRIFYR